MIPANRISPTSKKLLEFYQTPTLPGVTNNYVQALSRPQNRDQFILRMDYVESSKSSWAGRYSWGDENESTPGLNQNGGKLVTNLEQYMGSNTRVAFAHRRHRNALRLHALLQLGGNAAGLPAQRGG